MDNGREKLRRKDEQSYWKKELPRTVEFLLFLSAILLVSVTFAQFVGVNLGAVFAEVLEAFPGA